MITTPFSEALVAIDDNCLHYHIEFNAVDAPAAAGAIAEGCDNSLDLFSLVSQINAAMPKASYPTVNGQPNPNDGQQFHVIILGNEYSRVVYVKLWSLSGYAHVTAEQWARAKAEMQRIGHDFGCDECDDYSTGQIQFMWRFWWD